MSDPLRHECGVALIRLLKPLQYYQEKYGSPLYGFNKLFLLMEKQHNRGQDGAGIGAVKLEMAQGLPYMFRERSIKANSLGRIFREQLEEYDEKVRRGIIHPEFAQTVKEHFNFGGEILIGHLRYGTSGAYTERACHPYFRKSNWPTKNLMLVGNFNMTNADQLNQVLIQRGQHPIFDTDTQTVLEEIGFHLDEAHNHIYRGLREEGLEGAAVQREISRRIDLNGVLAASSRQWDGGYTIAGIVGNGDCFVLRDPRGIRPCYYFRDEEVVAFASERAALMSIFNKEEKEVKAVPPGHVIVIRQDGTLRETMFGPPDVRPASCSFERIYFSRGNDAEIYRERKRLGAALAPQVLWAVDHDLKNTVISYIPNTAETAYFGLLDELRMMRRKYVKQAILEAQRTGTLTEEKLDEWIMDNWPRGERVANKDVKLRTFISQEKNRTQLVSHVYDITYGVVRPGTDNLVVIDDSIVRGTTLKESILRILIRTKPKKIVIVSTAPQIRYPDCYGIDMSELGKFIAFQAVVALLKEKGRTGLLQEVYQACVQQEHLPPGQMVNQVRKLYEEFTDDQVARKIADLVRPAGNSWKGELVVLFQTIENLHKACPDHTGDWYFTGNYPTPGGLSVLNRAYINYYDKREGRSY